MKTKIAMFGAVALLIVLAVIAGYGPGMWTGSAPDSASPRPAVGGGPALALDKRHVDLGIVPWDQQGTQTFLLTNWGDSPLEIDRISVTIEKGCDQVEAPQGRFSIASGDLAVLPISLGTHRKLGPHRIIVNIESNDPIQPTATASMEFVVTETVVSASEGPRLRVDKEVIDSGPVPFDWPLYEQFTLRNVGDEPLVLDGVPEVRVEEGC